MNSADTHPFSAIRLDRKVALVTGGARGIGRASAAALAAAGASVAILDHDGATAEATARAIGGDSAVEVSSHAADVTDEASLERAFATVTQHHGGVDILVNSAGITLRHAAVDHPLADWDKVVAVNR